jgi:hypothetical protein
MLESSVLRCISSSGTPPQRSFHRDAAGCKSASQVAVVLVSAAPSVQRPYQFVERYHSSIMNVPALSSASSTSSTVSASNKPLKPTDPALLFENYAALSFCDVQLNTHHGANIDRQRPRGAKWTGLYCKPLRENSYLSTHDDVILARWSSKQEQRQER